MTVAGRFGLIGVAALSLALICVNWAIAADDCKGDVQKLADLFEANDKKTAELGKELGKKYDLDTFMILFKLRRNGGFGVGEKPNTIKPDCIEDKLLDLRKAPMAQKDLDTQADAIRKMAFQTAALAEMTLHRCPVEKKQGKRDPADWKKWSEDMRQCSLELAESAKKKDPKAVKDSSAKLFQSCQKCHDGFRN